MYVFCVAPSGKIPIGTRYPGFTHLAANFDQFLLQTYLTSLLFLSFAEQHRLTFQESIRFQSFPIRCKTFSITIVYFTTFWLCCLHTHFTIFRHAWENKIRSQSIFQDSLSPSFLSPFCFMTKCNFTTNCIHAYFKRNRAFIFLSSFTSPVSTFKSFTSIPE